MQGDKLTLAAAGDCQTTTRHSPCKDPRFLELVELLRSVDVAYANEEMVIHNFGPNCFPRGKRNRGDIGTVTHAPPFVADELKWMGIDMVSVASNHACDWMFGGLKETIDNLDRVGLIHAGTGMNLAEARAPGFFDSEQGRVALITVDTSTPMFAAGDARRDAPGRPGMSPVRVSRKVTLDPKTFEGMREVTNVLRSLGIGHSQEPLPADVKEIDPYLESGPWSVKFVLGDKPGIMSFPDDKDVREVMQIVSDARRQADWVIVTQHHHLNDGVDKDWPSKAAETFARTCLDEGADAYIGTGAHRIQGIEIYKGRPIFYCLPDFIQQRDLGKAPPQDYYEAFGLGFTNTPMDAQDARGLRVTPPPRGSGMVVSTFNKHRVVDIKIYPVDPLADLQRWQWGRPIRADEAMGRKIVEHWAKLSEPYGTKIDYEKGVGIVRLP